MNQGEILNQIEIIVKRLNYCKDIKMKKEYLSRLKNLVSKLEEVCSE